MSTEQPTPAPAPAASAVAERERKARSAFRSYKVMAFVTGGMLLLLCLEMILKYGFNGGQPVLGTWIAIVHGWIYVIYAVTVFNLWSTMRWGFGRVVVLIAGGVVPVLSFVMERRAQGWFDADLPAVLRRVAARTR
jgi:integral membrane protein